MAIACAIASTPLAVGLGEALPAAVVLGQDPAHDLVGALAQRGDRRHHLLRGRASARSAPARRRGCPRRGAASASRPRGVALDDRLHVVDVVQADAGDLAAGGLDVARDGEVDQQQRPPVRARHHLLQLVALDHVVGRVGRGDDDVGALQLLGQLLEADGAAAEALGQPDRAVVAAVGDEDRLDAPRGERARGQLGGLAGADHQHAAARSRSPSVRCASSTATEGIETPFSPIAGLRRGRACRRRARRGRAG